MKTPKTSPMNTLIRMLGILHPGLLAVSIAFAQSVSAQEISVDELAPLDKPYPVEIRPAGEVELESLDRAFLPPRSDFEYMMSFQTPVRSQESRGTCSIFSAIAMLESMMIRQGYVSEDEAATLDLSEEWLQYVSTRYQTEDGSFSPTNYNAIVSNGFVTERDLPYDGSEWTLPLYGTAKERCGLLSGVNLKSCLIGHWNPDLLTTPWQILTNPASGALYDPEFARVRALGHEYRRRYIDGNVSGKYNVWSYNEVKRLLNEGYAVNMGMNVYYGAWNHRIADDLGIGRNMDHWYKGIVGYPEPGSMDYERSLEKAAGHSVLLVGYDDEVEVETSVRMRDGSYRKFRYRGVYYFKNSWGTTAFGRDFRVNGVRYPGYGVITQRYVHEYGSFHRFPLRERE